MHDPDFSALAAVDIGGEVEEFSVLPRARGVKQLLHHDERAAVVLNHPSQKQPVELFALCFSETVHLLRRKHAGHEHRLRIHS